MKDSSDSVTLTTSGLWEYYNSSIYGDGIVVSKSDFTKRYTSL
jgi:hypothetical protein